MWRTGLSLCVTCRGRDRGKVSLGPGLSWEESYVSLALEPASGTHPSETQTNERALLLSGWGWKRQRLCFFFLPEAECSVADIPVISYLKQLSALAICNRSHPLPLHYSPITKEPLLILACFLLFVCVCECVCVCVCSCARWHTNEVEDSNIALGENKDVATRGKAVKQANTLSLFPLTFNFPHLDNLETHNKIMCVQPWRVDSMWA